MSISSRLLTRNYAMPQPPRLINLYAPSISLTIESVALRYWLPLDTILADIRAALGNIHRAFPYDTRIRPITSFRHFEEGKTVVVGTGFFETPLNNKKRDILFVQRGTAQMAWLVSLSCEEVKGGLKGVDDSYRNSHNAINATTFAK